MIKLKDLINEGNFPESGILSGGNVGGGSKAATNVLNAITLGDPVAFGDYTNTHNWAAHFKEGIEFGLKNKVKVGGKTVSVVQVKAVGKNKYDIAYLDWDNGERPLITRKVQKNLNSDKLRNELRKNVKVHE